jgi:hypothetical protein
MKGEMSQTEILDVQRTRFPNHKPFALAQEDHSNRLVELVSYPYPSGWEGEPSSDRRWLVMVRMTVGDPTSMIEAPAPRYSPLLSGGATMTISDLREGLDFEGAKVLPGHTKRTSPVVMVPTTGGRRRRGRQYRALYSGTTRIAELTSEEWDAICEPSDDPTDRD